MLMSKEILCHRALKLGGDNVSHKRKAEIVRVAGVDGAHSLVRSSEYRGSVDVVYVPVSVCTCAAEAFIDDLAARKVRVIAVVKVALREHNIGNVGVRGADLLIHLVVSCAQMLA